MLCLNCREPIVDESDANDPEPEWVHTGYPMSWRCRDDSGNHAEPTGPKWGRGVEAYRKSIADGNPMSQRELADYLEMKNRTLAAQIIAHVRNETREG